MANQDKFSIYLSFLLRHHPEEVPVEYIAEVLYQLPQ